METHKIFKYIFYLAFILLSASSITFAQLTGSIKGTVVDKTTGIELSDVNVTVEGTKSGTASDRMGYFIIEKIPVGLYTIEFSSIGYKKFIMEPVIVQPNKTTSIHVQLEPTVIKMNKVVVTASRRPRLLEQVPDMVIVQNAIDIRTMGAVQVNDVIESIPGVDIVGGTMAGQPFKRTLTINGMPSYYCLVLLDGKRVLSSHIHTGVNVNVVPPEHIERIELVKGAISSQYGSDGMAGVLNIITRKGGMEENQGLSFTSYTGSQKTYHSGISLTGSIGKYMNHSFCTGWEQSDGVPIIEPVRRVDKLAYTMFNLVDRIDVNISNTLKAGASVHYINTETPYMQDPDASYMVMPSVDLEYKITDNTLVNASGYYTKWNSEKNDELNEIASPMLTISYGGLKHHYFLCGAEYIFRNFTRRAVPENNQRAVGLFLQDEITLGPSWQFLAAFRYDKVENIDQVFSPKLSALYRMNKNLFWRISAGRGFRAPTVQDLYETLYGHPGNIHYRAGNPDLQPEYSTTFSSGIDWKLTNKISVMLSGYYYAIDNMITPVDHGLEDPTKYFAPELVPVGIDSLIYIYRRENIHQGMVAGGEISMIYNFLPGYLLEWGFNLSHNENKETGQSLPYYPGKSVSIKLQGRQYITKWLTLSGVVSLNAATGRKIWKFKHDAEQQVSLEDYQKLDAALNFIFPNGYELFLNAENLLAQELHFYEDVDFILEGTPLFRMGLRLNSY